jgi:guanylate kinase
MSSESQPQTDWSRLPGRLVVISGASGSGKSTLVQRLLARPELRLRRSVSATTRKPRPGEQPGRDYLFVTAEEFERTRQNLLEDARVHDHFYGTPAEPVRQAMAQGICVLLVIDVQGGFQVRQKVPGALLIFIQAPSLGDLESRLRKRATDDDATIDRRLANARRELEMAEAYDVHVINDELDRAVAELVSILKQRGCGEGKNHD